MNSDLISACEVLKTEIKCFAGEVLFLLLSP